MKVGLETVVSYFEGDIMKREDFDYLQSTLPPGLKGVFKGPEQRYRFRNDDAAEILATKAAKKALDKANLSPSDIDYIISGNTGGKYVLPMVGCYVHNKLGFRKETPVLNVATCCSSFIDAFEVAWNYIIAGKYKKILVVMSSAWETSGGGGRIDLTDFTGVLMGDGAAAAIVSSENLKCEFITYHNRTFGELYDLCYCAPKGPVHAEMRQAKDQPPIGNYLFTAPEFLPFWAEHAEGFGIEGIQGALKQANLSLKAIDTVLFHQPFDMLYDMWMDGAAKAGLSKDKWKHTWQKYGNLSNVVIPVNLAEFSEKGELKKDSIIALLAIGAGFHAPTMLIRWLA